MRYTRQDIAAYLEKVKNAVRKNRYRYDQGRADNRKLFFSYVFTEHDAQRILLSLEVEDFCEARQNEHPDYAHEMLYIFGKDVRLLERFGASPRAVKVSLYIKFNLVSEDFVIVISLHEQKWPLNYYFKSKYRKQNNDR